MGCRPAFAATQVNLFEGTCYLTPVLGAWLADAHWGRYKTILVFSGIYFVVSVTQIVGMPTCYNRNLMSLQFCSAVPQVWLYHGLMRTFASHLEIMSLHAYAIVCQLHGGNTHPKHI